MSDFPIINHPKTFSFVFSGIKIIYLERFSTFDFNCFALMSLLCKETNKMTETVLLSQMTSILG